MAEEVFVCPFCGAPYRTFIPSGVVQVKCQYCGGTVLVPPRLGEVVQRCPSHPEALAVGTLHLCSSCYDSRNSTKMVGVVFFAVFSVILFLVFFGLMMSPPWPSSGAPLQFLFAAITFSVLAVVVYSDAKVRRLSVREAVERGGSSPKSFLKKCLSCGKEIPIASEECAHCGAKQPEYVG